MKLLLLALGCVVHAQDFSNVQEMMEHNVARYRMVGVDAGAFLGSPGAYLSRAYAGERIFGSGVPIGGEDMFILGSSGKSMTSTMAARVVAKGYISWKTTTKEIFHDTGLFDVHPSFQNSTLESFVSHGSGAPGLEIVVDKYHDMVDYIFNKTSWEPGFDNRPARLYLSQTILKDRVTVTPGEYLYSIGGFTVAGAMLEAATNKTFEQLMTEELYEPLGMTGCGFGPTTTSTDQPPAQPWGHLGDSWAAHVVPVPPSPYANVASAMIPDGGLHCNLNSWQRYLAAHLAEDEDFLPKDMWTYIHTPITQDFYGFGWMIDNSNDETGPILQHGGTDGHNFAQAIIVPRFGIGLNIGTNNGGGLSESRQSTGFSKTLSWIFEHLGGKLGVDLSSVAIDNSFLGLDMHGLKRTTFA